MNGSIRIGIMTSWPEDDWHSARLLGAFARRGEAIALDPSALAAGVRDGGVGVLAGGRPASAFDAFLLARGLGRAGDPDVQFEIYRALEGSGSLLVNRLDPLLSAQDKFRTSWLLARAGVATPRAAVAQSARDAEAALEREKAEARAARPPDEPARQLSAEDRALRARIEALLAEHGGNVTAVAEAMGKHRTQVRRWIARLGIDVRR